MLVDESFTGDASEWSVETLDAAKRMLSERGHTREIDTPDGKVLLRLISQPYRLFVIGAGHISLHLVQFAKALNYRTIVIDPRESFAQEDRFEVAPDFLMPEWPEAAFKGVRFSAFDSVVLLTHDPKIDDQALKIVLRSDANYIGALGSRKSHAARLKRLLAEGFNESQLERIHGPVGLDIGSTTPAEIAISIVAQLVEKKNALLRGKAKVV